MGNKVVLNVNDLNVICKELMKELWNDKLTIPVKISGRLSTTLGKFISRTSREGKRTPLEIVISKKLVSGDYKASTIESILKHELCHYYLYKSNVRDYFDGDRSFENELKKIGAHSTKVISVCGERYVIRCAKCNSIVATAQSEKRYNNILQGSISRCCHSKLVGCGKEYLKDTCEEINVGKKTNIVQQYIALNNKIMDEVASTIDEKPKNKLRIEEIVKPGKRGVLKEQVYHAMINAIKEKEPEKLKLIQRHYEDLFNDVCAKNLSKKRLSYVKDSCR